MILTNKKNILIFFLILLLFFCGIWFERFGLNNKIKVNLTNFFELIIRGVHKPELKANFSLMIDQENYEKIHQSRLKVINKKIKLASDDDFEWVKAKLTVNNIQHDVKVKLKGKFSDHWENEQEMSFKVKIESSSLPILGQTRFALQSAKTTSYLYEWLFMKALEREKLLTLGLDFINLKINGDSKGVYTLVSQASEEFLERNNRKNGPMIGFDSKLFFNEQIRSTILSDNGVIRPANSNEDSFFRASILPVQFDEETKDKNNLKNLERAIFLLESFRQGKLKTSEVFDVDQLSKSMALRALLGASPIDWLDEKFYYNDKTDLLEPISKEIHVDLEANWKVYFNPWWMSSSKIADHYFNNKDFFLDTIYKDKKFYKTYISQLNKFSEIKYFNNLIEENKNEFEKFKKVLSINHLNKKIFSFEQLEVSRLRIRDFVDPVQGINVYFKDFSDGYLTLGMYNQQRLPVEIKSLEFENGDKLILNDYLDTQEPFKPMKEKTLKINCNFLESCSQENIKNQKIIFNILGQTKLRNINIEPFYFK